MIKIYFSLVLTLLLLPVPLSSTEPLNMDEQLENLVEKYLLLESEFRRSGQIKDTWGLLASTGTIELSTGNYSYGLMCSLAGNRVVFLTSKSKTIEMNKYKYDPDKDVLEQMVRLVYVELPEEIASQFGSDADFKFVGLGLYLIKE